MKKKILLIFIMVMVCTLLAGCYRSEVKIKVKKNAKFKVTQQIMVSKKYYQVDSKKRISANKVYKNLKKEIRNNYSKSKKTLKFKKIQKRINGVKYYGYTVTGIKNSEFKDSIKTYKKKGRVYMVMDMRDSESDSDTEVTEDGAGEIVGMFKEGGISIKMKITFPRKPKTTYGKVKGKTVTIDVLNYMKKYPEGGIITMSSRK